MDAYPAELWAAAHIADHATVLRLARATRGWTQTELASRSGYSPSAISRFESGKRRISDIVKLRHLVTVLGLPPEAFGLTMALDGARSSVASSPSARRPPTLGRVSTDECTRDSPDAAGVSAQEEDDPVRRRVFLVSAGLASASFSVSAIAASSAYLDPAAILADRLEHALTHTIDTRPATLSAVHRILAHAREDFHASRYLSLADKLPTLISTAETIGTGDPARIDALAQTYNLVTRVLLKLPKGGFEWVSADRALRAAQASENRLAHAEAQRLRGSALRRAGHHERAQALTLTAAETLDLGDNAPAEHLALYGDLLCSAGYAAARAGDRHRAADLLQEAGGTARRLARHPRRANALTANVISHQVSAAYLLGDPDLAVEHARRADLATFPSSERQGRLLVDLALAYTEWGKPRAAYRALAAAERVAPQEVRTRATVRGLVTTLLGSATIPGLEQLARRVHVPL